MKSTIANTPISRTQLQVSAYFGNNVAKTISDEAKVHFLHKPYANDFRECRRRVKNDE